MAVADVKTNIDSSDVHDALLRTFQMWISWSLGVGKLGGKMLRHPSGRMAAALKADSDPDGNVVAIYIDQEELGSEEFNYILHGHKEFSLKRRMLRPGLPGVKRSKAGNLYRYIPISTSPISPRASFSSAIISNLLTTKRTEQGGVTRINRNLARMWLANYNRAHRTSDRIRTMSYRPGSARWVIPKMPAFNITKLLKDSLPKQLKDRVIT